MKSFKAWGEKFRGLRLTAGYASQREFADHLADEGLILNDFQISKLENGYEDAIPKKRPPHLKFIEIFVKLGSLNTPEEANEWLALAEQGYLTSEEHQQIFGNLATTEPKTENRTIHEPALVPHIKQVIEGSGNVVFGYISGGQFAVHTQPAQTHTTNSTQTIVTEADLAQLRAALSDLRSRIEIEAPPERKNTALEWMVKLEETLIPASLLDKMTYDLDLDTVAYLKRWFAKNIPSLNEAVTFVIIHPVVLKLVDVTGEPLASEFRHRFNVP